MRREYYLHKRKSGVYYVEFIDKASGRKLSARSTVETDKVKAQVKAELWKINGIPTGRLGKPRPIEEAAGIESAIKAIRRADLDPDDALRIVRTLKGMGLIDIAAVKNTGRGRFHSSRSLNPFGTMTSPSIYATGLPTGTAFPEAMPTSAAKDLTPK